jgi:hemerythrin-like metal-binding protein
MSLLEWRDEFRIGIEEVDYEHRTLIGLINAAHARCTSVPDLEDALGEIHAAITAHFALEEKDMRARAYPGLARHKAEHERLLEDIRDMMEQTSHGAYPGDAAFSKRLDDWFAGHFGTEDVLFHRFLAHGE